MAQDPSKPAMLTLVRGSVAASLDVPTVGTAFSAGAPTVSGPMPAALAVQPPPPRDLSGTLLLGRYCLIKKLGEGGMGTVYLAEHVTIQKRCAIKVLNPEYAHKQDLVDRFLQEARAASLIAHENVVEITDYGEAPNGSVFFVMEMLDGEDLSATIRREAPLPWSRVAPMALQMCRALGAAHKKGVIHRDLKPENCFRIERHGNPDFLKVLDFGIAKVTSSDPSDNANRLTSTGMIFGTPTYMSPEQAQGERVDNRSDIYALGVILYELVTGKVPFSADNFMGILTKHMFDEPPAPTKAAPEADICPEVEALILKALQKDRSFRFQTMEELAAAIMAVGTGAAPVVVIPEARTRPISDGQPTAYLYRADTSPTARAHGEVTLAEPLTLPPAQRRGAFAVLVVILAVLGGAGGAILATGGLGDDPPAAAGPGMHPGEPVAIVAPIEAPPAVPVPTAVTPDPPAKPPELTPAPATTRIAVHCNVAAEVVDATTSEVLGHSGDDGIELALAGGPRQVIVRAAGYLDEPLALDPAKQGPVSVDLKPARKVDRPVKPVKPVKPDTKVSTTPTSDPKPSGTLGLKNPFDKH